MNKPSTTTLVLRKKGAKIALRDVANTIAIVSDTIENLTNISSLIGQATNDSEVRAKELITRIKADLHELIPCVTAISTPT